MANENPYSVLLSIPKDVADPDHYQLLGIARFTDDQRAIRDAALDQNRKLLLWQNSNEHFADVKKLMEDIANALIVLASPETKSAYDRALRERLGQIPPSQIDTLDIRATTTVDDADFLERAVLLEEEDGPDDAEREASNAADWVLLRVSWGLAASFVLFLVLPWYWALFLSCLFGIPLVFGFQQILDVSNASLSSQAGKKATRSRHRSQMSPEEKANDLLENIMSIKEPAVRDLRRVALLKIIAKFPETTAAKQARKILDRKKF